MKPPVFLLMLVLAATFAQADPREWTSSDGKVITAEQVGIDFDKLTVSLKLTNGETYNVPLARLSAADQQAAKDWRAPAAVSLQMEVGPPKSSQHNTWTTNWGSYIADFITNREGTVYLRNMGVSAHTFRVRYFFLGFQQGSHANAPRGLVAVGSTTVQLTPGQAADMSMFGTSVSHVQNYVMLGIRIVNGQLIDSVAVTVEDEDGHTLDVEATRQDVTDYVTKNYADLVTQSGDAIQTTAAVTQVRGQPLTVEADN